MCDFFSFITIPDKKRYLYFDWKQRQAMIEGYDSHSHIVKYYEVTTDDFNAYEYNPLTKELVVDAINGEDEAEEWVRSLDFKTIVEPLIIKPIVNPFELPERTVTNDDIELLKQYVGGHPYMDVSAISSDEVIDIINQLKSAYLKGQEDGKD